MPVASDAGGTRGWASYERLVDAVTLVAARDGYVNLTVGRVLAAAGVSRATFYQYFSSGDDCFWTAYRQHADRLVSDVRAAVRGKRHRPPAALNALVAMVSSQPDVARLLLREGLAAGPAGLTERDGLISRNRRRDDRFCNREMHD
jgi:TetR/AcrR family transcriptional regulator